MYMYLADLSCWAVCTVQLMLMSNKCCCHLLQVKEFDRSIDVDSVVFVIWQWEWKEAADDLNTSDSNDEVTDS